MARQDDYEPIAIVGLACRLPGDISSPSELWDFLAQEKSAQSDFPKNRLNIDSWYHPDTQRPGSIATKGGYFLSDSDSFREFDPSFFGISPLEAASLDPQQRKLLEVIYESFESAGLKLDDVSGSNTGCFVGNFTWDIGQMQARDVDFGTPYQMTGGGLTILSNRVNYVFNLKGPSLTLDTACSSTMYALHLACKSLQAGDCSAAVVGGTNLIFGIEQQIGSVRLGTLSPTSVCHTFDESADGYARAEAVGSIYIKRLSDAIKDGNPIRAVIRATSINTNGKGPGISHPSAADQEAVIRKAYSNAGLGYEDTGYFESHGTGTPVGDPIEFSAIGNVFGSLRQPETPLLIGSVKTNLGHGEAASAIPSLIKAILSLENASIPATIGIKKFNPALNFHGGALKVVQKLTEWPTEHTYRRASVNSFGYGGANAHTILDATDSYLGRILTSFGRLRSLGITNGNGHAVVNGNGTNGDRNGNGKIESLDDMKTYLLPFSAHNEQTLQKNFSAVSQVSDHCLISDLAYTLSTARSSLSSRAFTLVSRPKHGTAGQLAEDGLRFGGTANDTPILAFVFTGQGAQWPRMGMTLIEEYSSVRRSIEEMDTILAALPEPPGWTIMDTLAEPKSTSKINDAERSQTVCTAVQVAVVELLRSWRVQPKAVVGHSSGEIAAAFTAGYITFRQAIIIAFLRGRAVSRNDTPGAMLAVGVGADVVSEFITQIPNIGIACHNSPNAVTLSGTEEAVDEAHGVFSRSGMFSRKLITSRNAYHSSLMKLAAIDYEDQLLKQLLGEHAPTRGTDRPIMFSSVTGKRVTSQTPLEYWRQNLESPVLFNQAAQSLLRSLPEVQYVVEVGPHSALGGPIKEIRAALGQSEEQLHYLSALKRNTNGVESILNLVGSLFLSGYPIALERVNADEYGSFLTDFPRYQWVYEDLYWSESRVSSDIRFREHPRHDILGSLIPGSSKSSPSWRNIIRLDQLPWLRDHKVGEDIVFPAAGYISLAIAAVAQASGLSKDSPTYTLRNVKIKSAMVLKESVGTESILDLHSLNTDNTEFDFTQTLGCNIVCHCPVQYWSAGYSKRGLVYGPAFKTLSNIRSTSDQFEALANVDLKASSGSIIQESEYPIHPTVIDACLQLSIIAAHRGDPNNLTKSYLPVAIEHMTLATSAGAASAERSAIRGLGRPNGLRSIKTAVELTDGDESSINSQSESKIPQPYSRLVWKPDINHLSGDQMNSLFSDPRANQNAQEYSAKLEEMASLAILDSVDRLSQLSQTVPEHLQNFVNWIKKESQSILRTGLGTLSKAQREKRIQEIAEQISQDVPEAAMIASLNSQMSAILSGDVDAYDAMAKDNPTPYIHEDEYCQSGAYVKLEKLMDLIAHEDPRLNILELGNGSAGPSRRMLSALRGRHAIPNYIKYQFTDDSAELLASIQESYKDYHKLEFTRLDICQDPTSQGFEEGSYDIIFAPNVIHAKRNLADTLEHCRRLLKPGGRLVMIETVRNQLAVGFLRGIRFGFLSTFEDGGLENPLLSKSEWNQRLLEAGFAGAAVILDDYPEPNNCSALMVSMANPVQEDSDTAKTTVARTNEARDNEEAVLLLYRHEPHPLLVEVEKLYQSQSIPTRRMAFTDFPKSDNHKARTIMLAELEGPMLSRMSETEMAAMRDYTQMASTAVWVTNSDVLSGREPEKTLVFGISKSVMTEQPSFHLSSIDVDPDATGATLSRSAQLVVEMEEEFHQNPNNMNTELVEKGGIVYTSRYIGDDDGNATFARSWTPPTERLPIRRNLSMSFEKIGRLDSYYFKDVLAAETALGETEVLIESRAFAFDKTGLAVMKGRKSHPFFTVETGGIVVKTGGKVQAIQPGDQVACLKPNTFETTLTVDERLVSRLDGSDKLEDIVSQLLPYTFAVHSLRNVCSLAGHDNILIDVSSPVLACAIVQIALRSGCNVYATYSSQEVKDLLETFKGVSLIDSRSEIQHAIPSALAFRVVMTNGFIDLSSVLRRVVDRGAHLALLSGRASIDLAAISASLISKGLTISYLDPLEMTSSNQSDVSSAMREAVHLLQHGLVSRIASKCFDFSQFSDAAATVNSSQARAVLTCDPKATSVPIKHTPETLTFNSNGTYLLIGCLGGLGRSLTTWMISRGARNFIFLSRSGADKPEAAALIRDLEGISQSQTYKLSLQVARGDVSKREDVAAAISLATTPIKGVIQAAMVLHELIFNTMSLQQWNQVIQPKVLGSIHLHELLKDQDLDFFVMTSSVLGAIGAATQSNYSAANAFLDAMARHRRSVGLQGTSVALGMILEVGHVEEHPEVEVALKRNGMYGIGVTEFLLAMEAACRRRDLSQPTPWGYDSCASSHIVTGMDPTRVTRAGGKGMWLSDNRLRNLLLAIGGETKEPRADGQTSSSQGTAASLKAAAETGGEKAVKSVIQQLLMERLSKLVLLPVQKMHAQKPLSVYGMDSMISAELRNWTWKEFKADVPFMSLLDQSLTFERLAEQVNNVMDAEFKSWLNVAST
ncbi:KR domain-containing protein [Hirsutella rhossiliensis]|uniref:KR domain-containing protein n=1 Tax=Hirsutella rhossiliensis TaxID=111463 RepID=A0A9P8SL80_9HYPO|nr:KR domain-containing protein [Hirsutella rhossiliensis]KAH0965540.1 KR domain-containing protein [Hirsutella rhossiliensis]